MCDGVGWFSNHVPTGKSMVESLESESVVLVHKEVVFIVCVGALLVVKSGREDVLPCSASIVFVENFFLSLV